MKRRHFLLGGSALVSTGWAGANDRVQVAIVGVGGRGNDLMNEVTKLPTAQVAALVDPDGRRTEAAAQKLVAKGAPRPRLESDMRRIFDSKDVDAVAIATCNHWHALSAVWAMQAGKDVYVEKPVSHNIFEGRMLVEFARKHGRVVQGGTQRRSYGRFRKIAELIHAGAIGDVYLAKWVFPGRRDSIGFKKPQPVPGWLNFDLWLGPAPQQDYHENLVHYNWHWFWDFGNGELGNNGIHLVDVARWCINKGLPSKVHSWGGRWGYYDQAQTPNTQNVTWTYPDGTAIVGELRGLYTTETFFWDFYGTKGHMHVESDGKFQIVLGRNKTPEPEVQPLEEIVHMKNFTDAVKSRNWKSLNAEIEQTHLSTALCHLGNISYRLDRELMFDPGKERFVGDDMANSLISRQYRAPYVVPDRA